MASPYRAWSWRRARARPPRRPGCRTARCAPRAARPPAGTSGCRPPRPARPPACASPPTRAGPEMQGVGFRAQFSKLIHAVNACEQERLAAGCGAQSVLQLARRFRRARVLMKGIRLWHCASFSTVAPCMSYVQRIHAMHKLKLCDDSDVSKQAEERPLKWCLKMVLSAGRTTAALNESAGVAMRSARRATSCVLAPMAAPGASTRSVRSGATRAGPPRRPQTAPAARPAGTGPGSAGPPPALPDRTQQAHVTAG